MLTNYGIPSQNTKLEFTKLANPTFTPTEKYGDIQFSNNGVYMACVYWYIHSPYIEIYKRTGDAFTRLSSIDVIPDGSADYVAWSPDDTYLAVAHQNGAGLSIYKRTDDNFAKLPAPSSYNTISFGANKPFWSPDGEHLAFIYSGNEFLVIYKRTGDTFTRITGLTMPTDRAHDLVYSSDGKFLVVGMTDPPYFHIHKRVGDTYTLLPTFVNNFNNSRDIFFTADSKYMILIHEGAPYVTTYSISGDTFTEITGIAPSYIPLKSNLSHNGIYLMMENFEGATEAYKIIDDNYIKIEDPPFSSRYLGINSTNKYDYMALAIETSPYLDLYKVSEV